MRSTLVQTINFSNTGNALETLVFGWSDPEPNHTWMVGPRSALCLDAPRAPFGYWLEVTWSAYVPKPHRWSQPVVINIGNRRIASYSVDREETAAFRCPPPRADERRLLIEFDHPDAVQPSEIEGLQDDRPLSLCLRQIRLFRADEPESVEFIGRYSSRMLAAQNSVSLRAEVEQIIGISVDKLLGRFELIAGNCDMGLALRELDYESLSLLRFAGATATVAIRGIETDFDGIGERLSTQIADNPIAEWMIVDDFGLRYHTHQSSRNMSESDVLSMQRRHISVLRRKLLEDLREGDKIFVYADHHDSRPLQTATALFIALNHLTPTRMLWVCPSDGERAGRVDEILPGLARASLPRFMPPLAAGHISVGGWLTVLFNAWLLFEFDESKSAPTAVLGGT